MGFTAGRFTKYHEEPKSPILDDPAKANICMYVEDIINLGSGKGALRACRERLSCKGDRSEMVQTAKAHKILEKNFEYIFQQIHSITKAHPDSLIKSEQLGKSPQPLENVLGNGSNKRKITALPFETFELCPKEHYSKSQFILKKNKRRTFCSRTANIHTNNNSFQNNPQLKAREPLELDSEQVCQTNAFKLCSLIEGKQLQQEEFEDDYISLLKLNKARAKYKLLEQLYCHTKQNLNSQSITKERLTDNSFQSLVYINQHKQKCDSSQLLTMMARNNVVA